MKKVFLFWSLILWSIFIQAQDAVEVVKVSGKKYVREVFEATFTDLDSTSASAKCSKLEQSEKQDSLRVVQLTGQLKQAQEKYADSKEKHTVHKKACDQAGFKHD